MGGTQSGEAQSRWPGRRERRADYLAGEGLARRQGQRVAFARDPFNTLRRRELDAAAAKLADETRLVHRPTAEGEYVAGTFRQMVALASGRFAMIDDGTGFQLVPWRPALDPYLRQHCLRHHDAERRCRAEIWTQDLPGSLMAQRDQYFFATARGNAIAKSQY